MELLAAFADTPVTVLAPYAAGDRDMVIAFPGMIRLPADLKRFGPALRNTLPG